MSNFLKTTELYKKKDKHVRCLHNCNSINYILNELYYINYINYFIYINYFQLYERIYKVYFYF